MTGKDLGASKFIAKTKYLHVSSAMQSIALSGVATLSKFGKSKKRIGVLLVISLMVSSFIATVAPTYALVSTVAVRAYVRDGTL